MNLKEVKELGMGFQKNLKEVKESRMDLESKRMNNRACFSIWRPSGEKATADAATEAYKKGGRTSQVIIDQSKIEDYSMHTKLQVGLRHYWRAFAL